LKAGALDTISLARARLAGDGGVGAAGTGGAAGLCKDLSNRPEEGVPDDAVEAAHALLEPWSGAAGTEAAQALLVAFTETLFESLQPAAKETTFGSLGCQEDDARELDKILGAAQALLPGTFTCTGCAGTLTGGGTTTAARQTRGALAEREAGAADVEIDSAGCGAGAERLGGRTKDESEASSSLYFCSEGEMSSSWSETV
jgi:hypothetical protein